MHTTHILVVEDESIIALDIADGLRRLGYRVVAVVPSGEQAIQKAAETHPDLVLMDIKLKGDMDGVQAAEHIRAELDIPVIFLTAFADEATLQRAKITQPFGYLLKPFEDRELHSAIEIALYKHHADAEIRRRNRELALLNRVIAASAASLEAQAILDSVCHELAEALGLPRVSAALLDDDRTTARLVAGYGAAELLPTSDNSIAVAELPWLEHLVEHTTPLAAQGDTSALAVPLSLGGEVVGGLRLESDAPRRFSAEEVRLAQSVACQVAGALARAHFEQERRKLSEQHHQARKLEALGQLTGGIAHEFNNLLTVINGYAELLQLQLAPQQSPHDSVAKIRRASQRAADLVRQLLAFSRTQFVQPEVLDLNQVVAAMHDMLGRIIGEHIATQTLLAPDLWPVAVDPAQFELLIMNLVVNARDAMPGGGRLVLETANVVLEAGYPANQVGLPPGDYVLLTVSDTGVGMSPEVKARIFEPFFTTKDVGQGTGLGLATVHGIVQQNGGNILCDSEEGLGATFKIYLPRAQAIARSHADRPGAPQAQGGTETLLLVEDDTEVRQLACRVLQEQGYTLLEAENGRQALEVAGDYPGPIHLLLTDMVMPGMSGLDLAQHLAQARLDIKTLFMSGYTEAVLPQPAPGDGCTAFLPKPFNAISLAYKVREVLDATCTH